ncbi:hypothetical protein GO283_01977 [Ralstonia solanacearum]|nr:hypothetical protein [Ralstonia solanacearum]
METHEPSFNHNMQLTVCDITHWSVGIVLPTQVPLEHAVGKSVLS